MGERAMLHRLWDKWASNNVGPSGKPLQGAAVVNLASDRPSRFPGLVLEQEGMSITAADVRPLLEAVKDLSLITNYITLGIHKYIVTCVYESVFCARCVNPATPNRGGAIIARTRNYLIISKYEGSVGPAAKAMVATDLLIDLLTPRAI